MTSRNTELNDWVNSVAKLTSAKEVYWCTGSQEEYDNLAKKLVDSGDFIKLNEKTYPNSYLHRSDPKDVARVEHLTFLCHKNREDAGPNNHWMDPTEAHNKIDALFSGCMKDRTMYVVPYCMGPIDAPSARCGVEITDSPYVVLNMNIMTRMGTQALNRIEKDNQFVKGLHSTGELDPDRRFIMHFPEEKMIKSYGSGYGGNALLGKKCHALRIASFQAKQEGWLAEHMLILGLENKSGEKKYFAAAFPSACGKTNLAMLIPPEMFSEYKVTTIGDDIAWLTLDKEGQLRAINPEAGFFGVAPGTSAKTNPNALNMLHANCIFTNVGLTKDNEPWWEDKTEEVPAEGMINWKGKPYDPEKGPAAHPNSRFTVSAKQCASYSDEAENPEGVPISAIIFGGRRQELAPLVFEAKDWNHGVVVGASMGSETTAAATGATGVVRRDPMAMKPFCGYNFADYWSHWLSFQEKSNNLPKIFHVNWFRKDKDNKFMWPGFGDNIRVLDWIWKRCENKVDAKNSPIGGLPHLSDLNLEGLDIKESTMNELISIDEKLWSTEMKSIAKYFDTYGERMPEVMKNEVKKMQEQLS